MQSRLGGVMCVLCFTLSLMHLLANGRVQSETLALSSQASGNVFYEGQVPEIRITLPQVGKELTAINTQLYDVRNALVRAQNLEVEEDGNDVHVERLENLKCGYYTYVVTLSREKSKETSAFLKLAVIRPPPSGISASSPFAVDAFLSWRFDNPQQIREAAQLIHKAGSTSVRDRISWSDIQPERDQWDFSRYTISQEIQKEEGLHILQVFHDCPLWASEKEKGEASQRRKFPPANDLDAYRFFKTTARHFAETTSNWEIWNEMDIPVFFTGTADEYAEILKASYLAIKAGNPKGNVLLGSVTFGSGLITWGNESYYDEEGERYLEKILENNAHHFFDVFNVHHYGPVEGVVQKLQRCKQLLRRFNCHKPIWLTEIGSTSTAQVGEEVAESERQQAEYLAKAYTLAIAEGVEKIFYFSFPSFIEHGVSNWGIFQHHENGWQPKPGYVALANLINTLSGLRYQGYLTQAPQDVETLCFTEAGKLVVVAWGKEGEEKTLHLETTEKLVPVIRSLYGEDTILNAGNSFAIPLSVEPVFILFPSAEAFAPVDIVALPEEQWPPLKSQDSPQSMLKDVWLGLRHSPSRPGLFTEQFTGILNVYSVHKKKIKGEVRLWTEWSSQKQDIIREHVIIEPQQRKRLTWRLNLPRELRQRLSEARSELPLKAQFFAAPLKSSQTVRYVGFRQPLEWLRPTLIDETATTASFSLRFRWEEEKETTATLTISALPSRYGAISTPHRETRLSRSEGIQEIKVGFEKKVAPPEYPDCLFATASIMADEFQWERKMPLEPRAIPYRPSSIEVDGKDTEWKTVPCYWMGGAEQLAHGKEAYEGESDVSGRFRLCWDEDFLYMYVEVQDQALMNRYPAKNPWTGDAVELFLDVREKGQLGMPAYDSQVFQAFFVPPDSQRAEPYFRVWQPEGAEWRGLSYRMVSNSRKGYVLEARIPWKGLEVGNAAPGRELGFELTLDDIDPGDFEHKQLTWRGTSNNWRDPSVFSRMRLQRSSH